MIEPVSAATLPVLTTRPVDAAHSSFAYSSIGTWKQTTPSFFSWIFSPVMGLLYWILYRIAPSPEELARLEVVLDGIAQAALTMRCNRIEAETLLQKQIVEIDALYQIMTQKWLPSLEGVLFFRVNLLKIKVRVLAVLGEELGPTTRVIDCLGYELPESFGRQLDQLGKAKRSPYRQLIAISNFLYATWDKMRGRRDSNSQLPP